MIPDYEDIAEYIIKNYRNKVVEVGVGNLPQVALLLKDKLDVVVTDVNEQIHDGLMNPSKKDEYPGVHQSLMNPSKKDEYPWVHQRVKFYRDDIFAPDMAIYNNASLIYSIRPPIDLQEAMAKVAREVGADMLIRPFGIEKADLSRHFKNYAMVNYKKARFYLYRY
jgi:uncharacterized UPF0146 family protein